MNAAHSERAAAGGTGGEGRGELAPALGGVVALGGVAAVWLWGLGFGRATSCTSDPMPDCAALHLVLIAAHVLNVAVAALAATAMWRGRSRTATLWSQTGFVVVLCVAATLLSARGVLWG